MSKRDWGFALSLMKRGMGEAEFIKAWSVKVKTARERQKESQALSRLRNPELNLKIGRASYARHAERRRQEARANRLRKKSDPIAQAASNHYRNEYRKKRRESDPNYRFACALRNRIKEAFRKQYGNKSHKTVALLGCTIEECRIYIELLWKPGMTWQNYGLRGWHIDHIKPCASFDLTDPDQQKACFHYSNLQPLWWWDNLSKGAVFK